jgi:hypothetical protein
VHADTTVMNVLRSASIVLVCFTVSSCGNSTSAPPAQTPGSTMTPAPVLPHGTVPENLVFAGELTGRMDAARHGNAYTCGGLGSMFIVDPILGSIGGKSYELGIQITGFKGPGTYKTGGDLTPGSGVAAVSVWLKPEGTQNASRSKAGSIVVNDDRRSGTIDADLAGKIGSFHMAGNWTCPPDF